MRRLVDDFYHEMETAPEARGIRAMHPTDLSTSRDKLARFLCGWLGGPALYQEKYGTIVIPAVHAHLSIGAEERGAWLLCMGRAVAKQPFPEAFREYLMAQLAIPAERVRTR